MRIRLVLAVLALSLPPAYAKKPALNKDERVRHALDRLTFGPRPGDFERVRKIGLNKWIALQLHPERIAENPPLQARLRGLDTLTMSPAEMALAYPPPQLIRAMAAGRVPLPADPARRALVLKLAERPRTGEAGSALTPAELQVVRRGTPQQKLELLAAASPERLEGLLDALPAGVRYQVYPLAPPELRRRMAMLDGPQQVVAQDLNDAKLFRAVYSERQLEEVLVDFWFNHFNVFLDKGADRYLVTAYERDAIRPHVLGKFQGPAARHAPEPGDAVLPGQLAVGRAGREGRAGAAASTRTTAASCWNCTRWASTAATRRRTSSKWRAASPAGPSATRSAAALSSSIPRMHDDGEKIVLGVTIPAGGGERGRAEGARHPGAPPLHRALHLAQAGAAVRRRRPARRAGGADGAHLPRDGRRHRRGAARRCSRRREFWSRERLSRRR